MAVTIRRYSVVEPSTVEGFQNRLYEAVAGKKYLLIGAVRVPDELSLRRKGEPERETFTFRISTIHTDPTDFSVLVQNVETAEWSTIVVTSDGVSFSVVS